MAVRPSWEGHLRLSLVTCPVALYPATSQACTVKTKTGKKPCARRRAA
jgi:DNA end-binding protein Ku